MKNLDMRRKDRAKDKDFAFNVLDNAVFATLSMYDGNEPYSIPISHVRDNEMIYFHCAKVGRKIDILKKYPRICISVVSESNAMYLPNNFTTSFKSAIFYGNAVFVEDDTEKTHALKILCQKYLPQYMDNFDKAIQTSLKATQIIKIELDSFSAKERPKK